MSDNIGIISVDNHDNLIFGVPLKVANYEIKPSEGGVLANGAPYTATVGVASGIPTAKDYTGIRIPLQTDYVMGSAPIDVGIDLNAVTRKTKFFIYLDGPGQVLPGVNNYIETVTFNLVLHNVQNPANPNFTALFYSNMFSTGSAIVKETHTSQLQQIDYTVTANFRNSVYSFSVDQWMKPGDCGFFLELLPK